MCFQFMYLYFQRDSVHLVEGLQKEFVCELPDGLTTVMPKCSAIMTDFISGCRNTYSTLIFVVVSFIALYWPQFAAIREL